ncbi:MAG: glycosyltransferase Gtf1 [Candidatus Micrarchaeota archaeon]|nr:MAG: glycosyltransferase Gtf1 [Candidatus Micrarchaeota archaeon]
MSSYKILFISDLAYPWSIGGVEKLEYTIASKLSKHYKISFLTLKLDGMKGERFKLDNIDYITLGSFKGQLYEDGARSYKEAFYFAIRLLRSISLIKEYDLLFVNFFPIMHMPIINLIDKPKVIDIAEVWDLRYWISYYGIKGLIGSFIESIALSKKSYYIANSSSTKALLNKRGINRVSVFAPVIDLKRLSSISSKKERFILTSGRLVKEKRFDRFIEVIRDIVKRDGSIKAIICGNGPEKENLLRLIKSYGIEENIRIVPFMEKHEDYIKMLSSASLFIMPSIREGLSIVTIESIALGVPVILPDDTPIPKEVRSMCNIASFKEMPELALKIIDGDPNDYIYNRSNLNRFDAGRIVPFYSRLFKRLIDEYH